MRFDSDNVFNVAYALGWVGVPLYFAVAWLGWVLWGLGILICLVILLRNLKGWY